MKIEPEMSEDESDQGVGSDYDDVKDEDSKKDDTVSSENE